MPKIRVVTHNGGTEGEITLATVVSFSEAVVFAQAVRHLTPWLVVEADPAVWLSARSIEELDGLPDADTLAVVVRRFYILARHQLLAQGIGNQRVDAQLPLTDGGGVPPDA